MKKCFRFWVLHPTACYIAEVFVLVAIFIPLALFTTMKVYWLSAGIVIVLLLLLYFALILPLLLCYCKNLFKRCAPEAVLAFISEVFDGANVLDALHGGSLSRMAQALWIDRGLFLFALGKNEEALENYRILESSGCKLTKLYRGIMMANLARIVAVRGDFAIADWYLHEMHEAFSSPMRKVGIFARTILEAEAFVAVQKGQTEHALELYAELGEHFPNKENQFLFYRVDYENHLGLTLFRSARLSESIPHFQYAAQNGGETVFAQNAASMLAYIAETEKSEGKRT